MPTVCVRRDIDVAAEDLPGIVECLVELAVRSSNTADLSALPARTLDYTAAIDLFDGPTPGRTTVRWTATFDAPDVAPSTISALRDLAFADFTERLRQQVLGRAHTDLAS